MHDDGLLQTSINPQNRREHRTTLTLKGERLADDAKAVLNHYYAPVLATLSDDQKQQLTEILSSIHREVCRGDRPGRCHQDYTN